MQLVCATNQQTIFPTNWLVWLTTLMKAIKEQLVRFTHELPLCKYGCFYISHLTTHLPLRFPFSLSSRPRSISVGVIRLTVLSDLPMCFAISIWVASGFSFTNRKSASSSRLQFEVPFQSAKMAL